MLVMFFLSSCADDRQIKVFCLPVPVITDDSQCLPVGTDDRCACLYSRIVRIRSTGNVDPVSYTLQK